MSHNRARERAALLGGVLLVVLALVPPLGHYARLYIWVRAIQDLLLAFIAPALIVVGAPWETLARRPARSAGRWLARPVATVVAFNLIWLGSHLTGLYDLTASNATFRYIESACYVGAG